MVRRCALVFPSHHGRGSFRETIRLRVSRLHEWTSCWGKKVVYKPRLINQVKLRHKASGHEKRCF
jgi:hypothetical protein